jgi:sulfite exporter TauE/SafE
MRRRTERRELSTPLALFQMGRLTTYTLLGALLGALGQMAAAVIRDWQGFISIGLGLLMALLGLSLLGLLPLQRWLASAALTRTVGRWLRRLMAAQHPLAPFGLGLTNGLLPCGPVYAVGLLVAISGNPLRGAVIMLVFGLGTLPAMLGVGFSISLLSVRLRTSLYRLAAMLVTLVGVQLALRGLAVSGQVAHAVVGGVMLW